jgi:hypothetical protein
MRSATGPLRLITLAIDRAAEWSSERDTLPPTRSLGIATVLALAAVLVAACLVDGPVLARLFLCGAAGAAVVDPLRRRLAYHRGYWRARTLTLRSALHAFTEDVSPVEWLRSEVASDRRILARSFPQEEER